MMKLFNLITLAAALAAANAAAQTPPAAAPQMLEAPTQPARAGASTPYSDSYVPRSMRQPQRDIAPATPVLMRFQAMQKLKKRFEEADADHSGALSREEARQAGLGIVDKNFDSIDTAQRGYVNFDDLNAYLIQRGEEARTR